MSSRACRPTSEFFWCSLSSSLLDVGYPLLQLRSIRRKSEEIGNIRPDRQTLGARGGRTRPFDGDVHIVQHAFQELIGLGSLGSFRSAGALVDVMLKSDLGEADIVGGDERGVIDGHRIIDDRVLLVAREQADQEIDRQQADRNQSKLPAKRARLPVACAIGMGIAVSRRVFRCNNLGRAHPSALPLVPCEPRRLGSLH